MKAALLTTHNAPLELVELQPEQLQYGQVFVRILASGICGAQLMEIAGTKVGGPMPHPLGHEACAEVVEVGPAVRQVKVGDRVVCHWRKGDGIESDYPRYKFVKKCPFPDALMEITSGKVTTFSDYSVCSENRLTPVPSDTPIELCALLGCSMSTALGVIENEANLKMGETVLIIGCGGLGLNLILAAKMRRAGDVCGTDLLAEKTMTVLHMGARYEMADFPGNSTFDVVIDTTGNESAIRDGLNRLNPSGRFIMVGQPRGNVTIENAVHLFQGEGKTIKATQGGMFQPSKDIPRYVKLYQSGQLNLDGIISHRLPLAEINTGIDLVRNGQAGRVLIIPLMLQCLLKT